MDTEPYMHVLLSKRSQSERGHVLCGSNWGTFWKRHTVETVRRPVVVRSWGKERPGQVEHRVFIGQWKDSVADTWWKTMDFGP